MTAPRPPRSPALVGSTEGTPVEVAIVDYGVGNLTSVRRALEAVGAAPRMARTAEEIERAGALLLPGVGSFGAAMSRLHERKLVAPLVAHARSDKPLLGICLGMQLLADEGHEHGLHQGLGLVPGRVTMLNDAGVRLPHIGWNDVVFEAPSRGMSQGIADASDFYFVHSFAFCPAEPGVVKAYAHHGTRFVCALEAGNLWATQFHPEKSQTAGLQLLTNFVRHCAVQGGGARMDGAGRVDGAAPASGDCRRAG